jgi:hypothetical protein
MIAKDKYFDQQKINSFKTLPGFYAPAMKEVSLSVVKTVKNDEIFVHINSLMIYFIMTWNR